LFNAKGSSKVAADGPGGPSLHQHPKQATLGIGFRHWMLDVGCSVTFAGPLYRKSFNASASAVPGERLTGLRERLSVRALFQK
jgi:hypothetical protein